MYGRFTEYTIYSFFPKFAAKTLYPNYPVKNEGVVPKLLRRHENLYGDLSAGSGFNAINRDLNYSINFLNEFQNKLMFGTEICTPQMSTPMADLLIKLRDAGKISSAIFKKIARLNAIKILNL
jgi:hypothetical protein